MAATNAAVAPNVYATSHAELVEMAKRDLTYLNHPNRDWIPERHTEGGQPLLNVLIVGAGQSATTISHMLKRERVNNVLMIDENPDGQEGPWSTFARMPTLRTPKNVTGPDLGVPSLTYRAFYEAEFGHAAWEQMVYAPATHWHKYVNWIRNTLGLNVRHSCRATNIEFVEAPEMSKEETSASYYRVTVDDLKTGEQSILYARKVVLATGIDGSGEWHVPASIRDAVPKTMYAHTREMIDFSVLKGKKIGILGAGASAFDNASVALESGVGQVHLFFRREKLPDVNVYKWMGFPGFHQNHFDLTDEQRWRFMHLILERGQLPPTDTYNRAMKHPNFSLHGSSPWTAVKTNKDGDKVIVTTPKEEFEFDFIIIATGFTTDLTLRKELQSVSKDILTWREVFEPPENLQSKELGNHPYLAENFRLVDKKTRKVTRQFQGLFFFTFGGFASNAVSGASITALKWCVPNVVHGILRSFYQEDAEQHYRILKEFNLKEY